MNRGYKTSLPVSSQIPLTKPKKGQNALTLSDGRNGRLLLNCKKSDCAFLDILAASGLRSWDYAPPDLATLAKREAEQRAEAHKRALQAKQIWQDAEPIAGTLAETYLCKARGITCALPDTVLRFHPECWHGATAKRYPALVALVAGGDGFSIHRTYLRNDGGAKADIDPAKMMLGATAGGAVRLSDEPGPIVACEGIETGLSLLSGLLSRPASVRAALSTSGMKALHLPSEVHRLTIASDGDTAGREAANALAIRATAMGWNVSLLPAPDGRDWADVLTAKDGAA